MPHDERMSQPGPEHDPLKWLRAIDDPAGASEPEAAIAELLDWAAREVDPKVLHNVRVPQRVLDAIAACVPDASLTSDLLARAEQRRRIVHQRELATQRAAVQFRAEAPGELLREIREHRHVSPEAAADALGLPIGVYREIEAGRRPWYVLNVEYLPALAALVSLTLSLLVLGLKVSARRRIVGQVRRRAAFALSRSDHSQEGSQARLDQLRAAFAMVGEENERAATFFRRADQLVTSSSKPR